MFALVESGSITKLLSGNKGIDDGVQHSRTIFTLWTEAERNVSIGIYTVEMDKSKLKNDEWYTMYRCDLHIWKWQGHRIIR